MTTRPKPDPCPCCSDDCPCDSNTGDNSEVGNCGCPTDLSSGVAEVRAGYLGTAFGGVQLTWYNQWRSGGSAASLNEGIGNNWATNQLAYLTQQESGEFAFVWTPGRGGKSVWFSQSGTDYVPDYGARQTLTKDGNTWRVTDPNGTVWEFDAITELISKQITPGGQVTEYLQDSGRVVESRRTVGDDVESRELTYDGNGRVSQITLWQGSVSTPHETAMRRLQLAYYESEVTGKGNVGDLKTITEQVPDGMGWADAGTRYFRYYTSDSASSFKGGLKYSVGPAGFVSLGGSPDSANDAQMLAASESYYEYSQTTRRVTKTMTHGGTQEYSIAFTQSPFADGYNNWHRKAVLTTPDGGTKTVYSNHAGQDLLIDLEKGSDHWITYMRYNGDGRLIERASPSAIDMSGTPYDEWEADLDVQLKEDEGLIRVTTYYDMVTPGTGGAPGYLKEQQVLRGSGGDVGNGGLVTVSKTEYETKSVGSGATAATVYPVSKQIVYRSDDSGGSQPVETSYSYTWHGSTTQVDSVTVHLPDVDGSQNGGDWLEENTRVQHFDIQGRLIKSVDAREIETEYEYDDATGAMIEMTQDPTGLNFITNYLPDDLGRTIRVTGPAHNVSGQTVRTVQWTVYLDDEHEIRTASGYLVGSTYTLVNPVRITRSDSSGRVVDEIEAKRGSGDEDTGELTAADSFSQTSWTRWTHYEYEDEGRLAATWVYHLIPSSGPGSSGTNYNKTTFDFDNAGRQNYVKSPAGTITRTVFNVRGLAVSAWVGTNDTGATDSNPAGSGSPNNMRPVSVNEYDNDNDGGDGLVTKVTSPVDDNSSNDREVEFGYDWRDRRTTVITTDGTNVFHAVSTYDNLGRVERIEELRTGSPDVLIGQSETEYDDRGQVFRTKRYAVNDDGDDPTIALVDNTWYDEDGNVLKTLPAGSELFTKNTYDAIGRNTASYQGYYSGGGTDSPLNLTDNVIFEQTVTSYDQASHVTQTAVLARYHDGTGTGALTAGTNARPSYTAYYFDGIGRSTAVAQYGNQGNDSTGFSRSGTIPTPSDTTLVSKTSYLPSGEVKDQIDPKNQITRSTYDNAGRVTSVIQNADSSPTQQVDTTYTADGQVAKLIAINATTGNQETEYTYGVSLSDSEIASNDLLQQVEYPDNGVVTYEYNRQGQRIEMTDQNGSVHVYEYDKLGRQVEDKVTPGSGVDGFVKRIQSRYDDRRRLEKVTSHSATTGGSVRSEIQYVYNDFSQVTTEYQQHGAGTSGSSPKVEYDYASGSANTIRRTSCTYPDSRVINYDYGTSGGANDKLSRIQKLKIGSTDIVEYEYLGLNQAVVQKYVEPSSDVVYTLDHGTANAYAGLDRFGRIIDLLWET